MSTHTTSRTVSVLGRWREVETDANSCKVKGGGVQLCERAKRGTNESEGVPQEQRLCLEMPSSACTVERGLCIPGRY